MILHVVQALIDAVDDVNKLLARRRECRILKALREVLGLCEMLETKANVLADLVELTLLLDEIFTCSVQRGRFGVDKLIFLRELVEGAEAVVDLKRLIPMTGSCGGCFNSPRLAASHIPSFACRADYKIPHERRRTGPGTCHRPDRIASRSSASIRLWCQAGRLWASPRRRPCRSRHPKTSQKASSRFNLLN